MTLATDIHALIRQLFPETCLRCDEISEYAFCAQCRSDFVRVENPCRRCGEPLPHATCPAAADDWAVDAIVAPFRYQPPLSQFLQQLKFGGRRRLGRPLGELLAAELAGKRAACDAIIAVPLHAARLRQRTFNQSEEIARAAAARLRQPLMTGCLGRHRDTPPQTRLAAHDRWRNLSGAFVVARSVACPRIALVDDVITTGATVNAAAIALKAAGTQRVEAWALARTGPEDQPARNR